MADIVIFYELPERELNNANLLKAEFEKRGYSVDILGYYNYRELIFPRKYKPKLLIGQQVITIMTLKDILSDSNLKSIKYLI